MAQQPLPPTRSKLNPTTSVSTLDPESSPKNDISGLRVLRGYRLRTSQGDTQERKASLYEKLDYLKCFSRCETDTQQKAIQGAKESSLYNTVKHIVKPGHVYPLRELYDLVLALTHSTDLDNWNLVTTDTRAIVYCNSNSIYPGLKFVAVDGGYQAQSFNYNVRF